MRLLEMHIATPRGYAAATFSGYLVHCTTQASHITHQEGQVALTEVSGSG